MSADVVDALARQAGVETVLLGSYIKAGDAIRINVKLQEAGTGRIVSSERVEGMGEADIFSMVDDLTRRIRERLLPLHGGGPVKGLFRPAGTTADAELDRGLKDVTTASIEAYRYYSEGIYLHERLKEREAIPLLLKAVEIDPSFAMALAKLAIVHSNLGQPTESAEYASRALEHASRLTPRERLYVEGVHYSRRPETTRQAIAAYRKAIGLYPDHAAARQNLAVIALNLENDDEAIPQLEELLRLGGTFPGSFSGLAGAYARKGSFERGYEVYQDSLRRFPDNAAQWANLGNYLVAWGRYDEASQAFDKARALGAREFTLFVGSVTIAMHHERWDEAAAMSRRIWGAPEPIARAAGGFTGGSVALYHGKA
ncbi:MAG: tetratricopeptide repeat protein, partial [Vicinamibacterales bacterium]